ncbi:MAG: hypothetical protein D8M58_10195 [Calditrichaeota bacterium]|nr:MAG: hypothetical protein DWQ03_09570 [Calditrichota bacterium]MBL1205759.1 hypothetical protein [Calditrichota bacterium]NOG45587.1 hypothetical protein [Calditrichota bacterium]
MNKLQIKLLYLLFAGLLFSCSSSTDSNGDGGESDINKSGQPMPSVTSVEGLEFGGVLATVLFEFETIPGFPAAQFAMGYAWFGNGDNAGDVAVNEQPLMAESQSGSTWYNSFSQTNPSSLNNVSFNGSNHNWEVAGNGDIPAFDLAVSSPSSFTLTSPVSGNIDKSNGLNITWVGSLNNTDSMLVLVVDLSNSKTYIAQGLPNNGQHSIEAADLSDISGEAMIQVVKYRYNLYQTETKFYQAVAEIVKQVTVTFQ